MILSAVHIQPFDIISDFVFSEGRLVGIAVGGEGWSQGKADIMGKGTCGGPRLLLLVFSLG